MDFELMGQYMIFSSIDIDPSQFFEKILIHTN